MRTDKQGRIALIVIAIFIMIVSLTSCSTTRDSLYKKNNLTTMQRKYKIQTECVFQGIYHGAEIQREWNFNKKYTNKQKRLGKHYIVGYNNFSKTRKFDELFAR